MKTCTVCKNSKSESEFYCKPRSPELRGHCKRCHLDTQKRWASTPRGKQSLRKNEQRYYWHLGGRAKRKESEQTPARREYHRARKSEYRATGAHLEQSRAHNVVRRAIAAGKLTKAPCVSCGDPKVHAHHEDYTRPLVVVWLCPRHHRERHI